MKQYVKRLLSVALSLAALTCLQACTSNAPSVSQSQVAHAFESTGTVAIQPYNRTIFSTSNF